MSTFINTLDAIGELALVDSLIDGSITEYRDNGVSKLWTYAFANCANLVTVDVPAVTIIIATVFTSCSSLTTLILRGAFCTLSVTSTFTGTPIASGTGYIYVPSSLLATYQAATNWSTFADQFRALEDYTVDGTIWGDLDETKI